jgi:hypothetical protein
MSADRKLADARKCDMRVGFRASVGLPALWRQDYLEQDNWRTLRNGLKFQGVI